jgi:DNA/RNA endonuclease G (NUC1)
MRIDLARAALVVGCGLSILSCVDSPTSSERGRLTPSSPRLATVPAPTIGISQVYGGGGNSGATLKNDFIELFNPGGTPVTITGWSVQYASSGGSTWQVTALSGTIQPGGYYLVQESAGTGGTTALPSPDATGTIAMGATAGKIALVSSTTALSGTCPAAGAAVDEVSFGTTATDCGAGTTATLSNTTAAIRLGGGCAYTGSLSADFSTGAPTPRNSASPISICPGLIPVGALDHVLIAGPATVTTGATIQLAATPQDANNQTVTTATVTWSSSDASVASVDQTGKVTGVAANPNPVTITATADDNGITSSAQKAITVLTPTINWIDVSSSSTSFPPGFQTQLFATARVSSGGTIIPATFTFEALDPAIATIATVANSGIITGVAAGNGTRPAFRITATPVGGGTPYVFDSRPVTIETPVNAPLSIYAVNDEFGDPTPASASNANDLLIVRPQYTLSYNQYRGTPNWVSYELDSRQVVPGQDRCNCFTADPTLPASAQIFTSDYTNGGYDRGHMARSFDRTAANVDNARTFYLTNIVPQMADLNQGVWAQFENALGDSATLGGRAVYIVTGPLYSTSHALSFIKNEGKVAIPDSTWKVALIGPRNSGTPFGRGNVQAWDDLAGLTVLAVNMPNVAGVRNDPWSKYLTTVDKIEAATGVDVLSLLQTAFQDALEAGDHAPAAQFAVSGALDEGSPVSFDASASTDVDLGRTDLGRTEALQYTWTFSDGGQATGKTVTHTFADNGSYTATLVVSDAFGWEKSSVQTVAIGNVAPTVSLAATTPLSILSGDAVSISASFTDPGSDAPWKALIDWGNGSTTPSTRSASGATITGTSSYLALGSHTITLSVADKDGASGSSSLSVSVARRPVRGDATPSSIALSDPLTGDIKITLYSDARADVTTLDLSSVTIGSVATTSGKRVKFKADAAGASTIVLRFDRSALVDAGVVGAGTTQLDVTGALANGVQIVSHVAFSAR